MKKEITSMIPPVWILEENNSVTVGTTRRGIATDYMNPYAGFSICHYTGDSPEHIATCRRLLSQYLSTGDAIIIPRQTHSVTVHTVTERNLNQVSPEACDGVVTAVPHVVIGINTADCVPVLLYDSENYVIGAAHAGWRGALGGIIDNTITAMKSLGALPSSIQAIICPAIGVECFEVGDEVAELFPGKFISRIYGVKPHINLTGYVKECLLKNDIPDQAIRDIGICTRCNHSMYFSARKLGIGSGRNFSFIYLNGDLS